MQKQRVPKTTVANEARAIGEGWGQKEYKSVQEYIYVKLYMLHLAPPVEYCPHLYRGCLLGVRLTRIPLNTSVVDQSVLLPITQSLSYDNLCAPVLSVAGTRAVIVRAQSKMVLIYVLLNVLTERCSHIRVVLGRSETCE